MRGGEGRRDQEIDDSSILQVQVVQLTDGIEQLQPTQSICVLSRQLCSNISTLSRWWICLSKDFRYK